MTLPRAQKLDAIARDGAFDVIVVGGGINGIGTFRDLCLQGLRVLLVEQNDLCSGCSAAPSRMIHGGLRYLENGEFALVRESLKERDALLRNAPHLVRPLPTMIPIERVMSGMANAAASFLGLPGKPRPRGAVPIKLGLTLYDAVSAGNRRLPRHQFHSRKETRQLWPALAPDVQWSASYHDAWISHPERLGVELILDAEAGNAQAVALNYARVDAAGDGFALTDQETGAVHPVTARVVVNATGAWLDRTAATLGATGEPRMVGGTKGSHLILDNPALARALAGHMIYFEHGDGRVCIVFPYLGRVLAGSTDIRVNDAARTACGDDERDYILGALQELFPDVPLDAGQIVYSYSGIRPLPVSNADFTGRISRAHFVHRIAGTVPQFCMVGGKWTTFRAFAEQTTDAVLAELGLVRRTGTADLPIGGGAGFADDMAGIIAARHGIEPARAAHLADLYGAAAEKVLAFCATVQDAPIHGADLTTGEVIFAVRHEMALHLADVLQRRSALAITGVLTDAIIALTADTMAPELGWDAARKAAEIAAFTRDLTTYHGVGRERLEGGKT